MEQELAGNITLIDSNCNRTSFFEQSVVHDRYAPAVGVSRVPELSDNVPSEVGYVIEGDNIEVIFFDLILQEDIANNAYEVCVEFAFLPEEKPEN